MTARLEPRRIGVFGGTFDPIHNAHLAVATMAADELGLETVLFVPAGDPYLRDPPIASIEHRVAMVWDAISHDVRFQLSMVDAKRPGPSYSIDTVRDIRAKYGEGVAIYLIIGGDAAIQLSRWRSAGQLTEEASLVVVERPDEVPPDLTRPIANAIYLDDVGADISATLIRDAVANGRRITGMVPPVVEQYIREHGLYRKRGRLDGEC